MHDVERNKEVEEKSESLAGAERDFAENSPMPAAELAETGVYCTGHECHKIQAKWERPISEVTPPRSSVKAVWTVPGFGSGKGSGGAHAPIHFGDTQPAEDAAGNGTKSREARKAMGETPAKGAPKKTVKGWAARASRKRRG